MKHAIGSLCAGILVYTCHEEAYAYDLAQASKAALHSLTETLSMELQPFGVEILEVWAGTFKTDINAKVSAGLEK